MGARAGVGAEQATHRELGASTSPLQQAEGEQEAVAEHKLAWRGRAGVSARRRAVCPLAAAPSPALVKIRLDVSRRESDKCPTRMP